MLLSRLAVRDNFILVDRFTESMIVKYVFEEWSDFWLSNLELNLLQNKVEQGPFAPRNRFETSSPMRVGSSASTQQPGRLI